MSLHSYTKAWLHLIWGTQNHEKSIGDRELRKELSEFYYKYSQEKKIFMKINFVNSDHVHALIDMPTNLSIEDLLHLLKGASSNWINKRIKYKFCWAKGYSVFSVQNLILIMLLDTFGIKMNIISLKVLLRNMKDF